MEISPNRGKIIFVNNNLSGFISFRIDIMEHFIADGWICILIIPKVQYDSDLVKFLPRSCKLICVDMQPNRLDLVADLKYLNELRKIYKNEQPDIIFHYTIKPNIYGTLAAKSLNLSSVAMVAGLGYMFTSDTFIKRLGRKLYKFALRKSDKVIVLNDSNAKTLSDGGYVVSDKLLLFDGGEGVNLKNYPYFSKTYSGSLRFLMIARLLYDKGYEEFVKAAEIVKRSFPNIEFELLGPLVTDSPMGVPEGKVWQDHKNGIINYLGVTHNVLNYLVRDNVAVVLPSYSEGLNRVLMESCSVGCPCITTDVPGCREAVENNVNGFIVPPKDANALADAIIKFILLPIERKIEMSRASRLKAENVFDVQKVVVRYEEVVREVFH